MSGGVDSSVAAAILVDQGYEVVGATMRTFCYSGTQGSPKTCCGLDGIRDARSVARRFGMEHHVFDVEEEFQRDVIDDFVAEYARGRTPNPCVRCNSNTKFRDLLRRGQELGCDRIASGHYARVAEVDGEISLLRGVDDSKDQTYFLWGISRDILERLILPVGGLTKPEVRDHARELGLVTADKPESQEICFVPEGTYRDLLAERLEPGHAALEPGPIEDSSGARVGMHDGFGGFTVGQRKGLGGGFGRPLFVLGIRPEDRAIVVGDRAELESSDATVAEAHWLTGRRPAPDESVGVRIRHRAPIVSCRVQTADSEQIKVEFDAPQPAITPGQSAVFYRGDQVLGGGRIVSSSNPGQRFRPADSAKSAILR
jgi:tRNA-specific 2-thiouridylase